MNRIKIIDLLNVKAIIFILPICFCMSVSALSVTDFGAVGDGETDDTEAIQKALLAVKKLEYFIRAGNSEELNWRGHGGHGTYGEVYFPAGTYRISSTLVFPERKVFLRGEPGTVIKQSNPGADIFYFSFAFRINVENITFQGGKNQLNFWTDNNDMTMLTVDQCRFEDSSGAAVSSEVLTVDNKKVAPYSLEWNGTKPVLTPNNRDGAKGCWNSTLLRIRNSEFKNCHKVLAAGCDLTLLTDCRIEAGANAADAVFEVVNNFNLLRVKAVNTSPRPEQVWIRHSTPEQRNNGDHFYGEGLDFDNAGENGLCLLYTQTKPGYVGTFVRLLNSALKSAGSLEGAFIRIGGGCQPNILTVSGNTERSGRPVKAVKFDTSPTAGVLENKIRYQPYRRFPIDTQFKVLVAGNSETVDESLPASLTPFRQPGIAAADRALAEVKEAAAEPWEYTRAIRVKVPDIRNAGEVIQAALDAAAPGSRVILPPHYLRIREPLNIPPDICLESNGMCAIECAEDGSVAVVKKPGRNLFRNVLFNKGQYGVSIEAEQGNYRFENCAFFNQKGYGVYAPGKDTAIRIEGSVFYTQGGLNTNSVHSELVANWVCQQPDMNEKGFNRNSGNMLAAYNLFVPILPRTHRDGRKPVPELAGKSGGSNVRWFDNEGKLHCSSNRFGGEFTGMTPIYHRADGGSILLEGGYCYYGNYYTRKCQIYCEKTPELIILNDVIGNAESARTDLPYNVWDSSGNFSEKIPVKASGLVMSKNPR